MMDLDANTAASAEQSHHYSPLCRALPQPGRQGRAVCIPEPPEAQTPVRSCSISLPGSAGLAHHAAWHGDTSFSRSLEKNTRSPEVSCPTLHQPHMLKGVFWCPLPSLAGGTLRDPHLQQAAAPFPGHFPEAHLRREEKRDDQRAPVWKRLRRSHKKNERNQEWLCSAPSVPHRKQKLLESSIHCLL